MNRMKLTEIAELIYLKSESINIEKEEYDENIFTREWVDKLNTKLLNKKGWYWISIELPLEKLSFLTPENPHKKGCNIKEVADNNLEIFTKNLLSKSHFYNGHAKNVVSRLRNHFYLKNDGTGALGLNAYPDLKTHKITVSFFTENLIDTSGLSASEKQIITKLITKSIGRTAIENAWRASNGFPILCKL